MDSADNQFFWKLSDEIVLRIIKNYIPKNGCRGKVVLDAGGGTGRWIVKLNKIYKDCDFILFDNSDDMLAKAEQNFKKEGLLNNVKIIKGDLEKMDSVPNESADYAISIYNPISFLLSPQKMAGNLYRIIKKGGLAVVMGQNFFNALTSKINSLASVSEIKNTKRRHIVKWGAKVPELKVFSKETLEEIFKNSGFRDITSFGVPVFVQPGAEDFDSKNKKRSTISKALENDPVFFKEVVEIEMAFNGLSSLVNKGMNILIVARK
ncbi:MAG: hypothetical protein UV34_C0012G0022 [Parcubacteria group bacterium GW2011_GWB1_42_6]|nr:MAG: hypothetical protein UV34_C0012G0022 [Parcubacteria group bacterium GW2011_GWB1_42_6]